MKNELKIDEHGDAVEKTTAIQTRRIEAALRVIEIYFRPWGAAKAAEWEEISDDRKFDPEIALQIVRRALCA